MASLIPAMKGQLGSTEYFVATMKAKELVERLTIPKDMEGWDDLSVEERYQREIDVKRVAKSIAPYFANDPDRFCGAFIVAIMNDQSSFESVVDVSHGLPGLYKMAAAGIGFLNLSGGEVLVPLDGQHRLKAIKFAITGVDDTGRSLHGIGPNTNLGQEDVTVILVKYEMNKARKIFNKVNRYARPTSKSQNLITDDDDVAAILTRDIADSIIGSRLVNIDSNTLSKQAVEFTTIATLYETVEHILQAGGHSLDKSSRPDKQKELLLKKEVENVWNELVTRIDLFVAALADKSESGDDRRREIRQDFLLGKPVGQQALVRAYMRLVTNDRGSGQKLSIADITSRLNRIDWTLASPVWQGVLTAGTKVNSGKTAVALGGDFIAYLAGEKLTLQESEELAARYQTVRPGESLPAPLVS